MTSEKRRGRRPDPVNPDGPLSLQPAEKQSSSDLQRSSHCSHCGCTQHAIAQCPDAVCYRCKSKGHIAKNCIMSHCGCTHCTPQQCPNAVCYRCKRKGHIAKDCADFAMRSLFESRKYVYILQADGSYKKCDELK